MLSFEGVSLELWWAAAWVFLFGLWVSSRDLPVRYALFVCAVKLLIPVAYFAQNPSGSIHVSDDLAYYYEALQLLQRGYDPVSIFLDPLGIPYLLNLAGGHHVLYHLWNLGSLSVFGPQYFSPVLFNVGATFVAGYFFARLLANVGFPRDHSRFALAFFLLHWDVLAWSSFLDLKDTMVLTLTLALMNQCVLVLKRATIARVGAVVLLVTAFLFLRMYVPFLAAASVFLYLFFQPGKAKKWMLPLGVLGALLCAAALWMAPGVWLNLSRVRPGEFLFGAVRFILTPLPWTVESQYSFLRIPSALHLLLVVPALLTFGTLWNRYPQARLVLIYLCVVVAFYSVVPELQGPRQRFQVAFVFAWMQFQALWSFARYLAGTEQSNTR